MSILYIGRYITKNQAYVKNKNRADDRYSTFQTRGPLGAVLHSIGTPQPSAKVISDYFDDPSVEASVHMVLQADGQCYQLAPDNYRMWHAGGSANNTHMGIEMTEPDCISYNAKNGYELTIHNRSKALEHVTKTYACAVELFADLCIKYNWDPLEYGVILSHKECYERGIGSNHGDPEHLWDALNTGFTMDTFRRDVAKKVQDLEDGDLARKIEAIVKKIIAQGNKEKQDNDSGEWSADARSWAIAVGIVNGVGTFPDGTPNYAWEAPVTREQMVTMLYRFASLLNCPYLKDNGGG